MRTLLSIIFILLLCASANVGAATYYVDPVSGDNANNGTSTATAWAQLPDTVGGSGAGWVTIQHGDSVIVKGGSINSVRVNFSASKWNGNAAWDSMILRSGHLHSPQWGTTRAVIDGGNTRTAGFAMGDSGLIQGLTIDGFEVRNIAAGAAGSPWDGSTGSSGILPGANYQCNWLTIKRCWIHDCARSVDNTGHGIEFGGWSTNFVVCYNEIGTNIGTKGIETYRASYGAVSNNFLHGGGDHQIALSGSTNVDCCNNLIYFSRAVHEPAYAIQVAECSRCDVWNNVLYRDTPVIQDDSGGHGTDWPCGIGCYSGGLSNRVVFNTVYGFGNHGNAGDVSAVRINGVGSDTGLILQNNLVLYSFNQFSGYRGGGYYVKTNYSSGENVRFNNFWSPTNALQMLYEGPSYYEFQNVADFEANDFPWATYADNEQADPAITGGTLPTGLDANWQPNQSFFALSSSSPSAVTTTGNGISGDAMHGWDHATTKFAVDILGNTRTAWSMGAYEYQSGTASRVTVQNLRVDRLILR